MTKNYSPIESVSTKQVFLNYINSLNIPHIDYFAIGVQNSILKKSMSLMSLSEWQKYFMDNQFADHDPVRKITLNTQRTIIPFDEIDHVDNFGKEIMKQRSNMGIKKGIILMQRFTRHNYMITLGTGFSKFDAFEFIKKHHDKIQLLKNDLIKIIEKDAKYFLLNSFSKCPSIDAK